MSATYTDDFDIEFPGPPGESQADILRRIGQYGVLPTDTDAQVMDKLAAAGVSAVAGPIFQPYLDQASASAATSLAARDGIVATLGAATEVTTVEAGGINLNVSYAAAADGTAGDAVGSPALVASAALTA
ncbi:MAG: hypothetical protein EOO80_16290 [Oxalobacteraceae bacterium]|nr:MAG: hypothetical protein EOO80_16290 [Oxalobacteraceae bacterium]